MKGCGPGGLDLLHHAVRHRQVIELTGIALTLLERPIQEFQHELVLSAG